VSELDRYDKRCGRQPLTEEEVANHIIAARQALEYADSAVAVEWQRVIVWLADHIADLKR
jgi:hypothetical protein